ncbi:MAG: hypothetical protein AMXMBFR81_14490 [Chthonomonas sp.]
MHFEADARLVRFVHETCDFGFGQSHGHAFIVRDGYPEFVARKVEVRVFRSPQEAEFADFEYYRSLTHEERIAILIELRRQVRGDEPRLERVAQIVQRERR